MGLGFIGSAAFILLVLGALVSIWYFIVYIASIINRKSFRLKKGGRRLKFAVIIPTYNDLVENAVASAFLSGEERVEVYVSDTSDKEDVKRANKIACDKYGAVWIWNKRGGYKAWNLNRALERMDLSKYDYVLILDADAVVPKDFFDVVEGYLEENRVEVLQTEWLPHPDMKFNLISYFSWIYAAVFQKLVTPVLNFFDVGLVFGNGFLVRSDVLERMGGFDERFIAEDFKFALDVQFDGGKVIYYPLTGVHVVQPSSIIEIAKQLERWGYGSIQVMDYSIRHLRINPATLVLFVTGLSAHVLTPLYLFLALYSMLFLKGALVPLVLAAITYFVGLLPLGVTAVYYMRNDGIKYPLWKKLLSYVSNLPFWFVFTWMGVAKYLAGLPLRWDPTEKVIVDGEQVN